MSGHSRGWGLAVVVAAMLTTITTYAADNPLWIESASVQQQWEGPDLYRVVDEETGTPCLEWHQNPATKGTATVVLHDIDPTQYDALRLQWKHLGGGSGLAVTIGKRNWYLFKDKYLPDVWRDTWLDLSLDDDQGGPLLQEDGSLKIQLHYYNLPQNRADEQVWRRVRVANVCLVKFPVRLGCDPVGVTYEQDEKSLRTIFPMELANATDQEQTVELLLDPAPLRDFTASFAQTELVLPPRGKAIVPLTFTITAERATAHEPLYIEEAPVYARVKGNADSLTTWYRGFVQWKPGGVIPPRQTAAPLMTDHAIPERVKAMAAAYPWAKEAYDRMLNVREALERPIVVPELRHGYSGHNVCPEHQKVVKFDLVNFKRHWCEAGKHFVEGVETLDRAAALAVHTRNSNECAELGWAWFLTGDKAAARKAAELLLAYAALYPDWDYANAGATGYHSRVGFSVLSECWWIHGFVEGYDLIANAPVMTAAEQQAIRQRFFATAANDIQTHRVSKNQQCEINWASGGAAIDAGNWYLAALRFSGSYGLRDMVELSFSEEGFSRENEFPYHYAALLPIVDQGVAWEALGAHFFDARVKRIFDAPLAFSIDQQLNWSNVFEVAYRFYGDPAYLSQLNRERPSRQSLLYGVNPLPELATGGELTNSSLPLAGKSTLRAGTPEELRAIQISWGASTYRGGQDMLNFLLNYHGVALNRSVTRIGYGYKIHGLSYHTLAGNLVQVDGLDQTGTRPLQMSIVDGQQPMARYEAPAGAAPYPGVRQSRCYAIVGDMFVIIDRLSADRERRFDLAYYPACDEVTVAPAATFTPYPALSGEGKGYDTLLEPAIGDCPAEFSLSYQAPIPKSKDTQGVQVHLLLDGPGQLIQSTTYTNWHPQKTPLYLIRRTAKTFTSVMVIDPDGAAAKIERLGVIADGEPVPPWEAVAVRITLKDGTVREVLDADSSITGKPSVVTP